MQSRPEPIFSRGFFVLCCVNFLFFAAFYMLIPVLPVYLLDDLGASKPVTGVLLAVYVLSALLVRPWSGHVVDTYPRKTVFLICVFSFALIFFGYLWITPLVLFGLLRVAHGVAFGMANTATTTLAVDTIPPARIGTGMGFFGMTTAVPMALGPMAGFFLYETSSADAVFYAALGAAMLAALLGLFAPGSTRNAEKPQQMPKKKNPVFLPNAGKAGIGLTFVAFAYGLVLNYISVYAKERGISINVGLFFCFLAIGMIISRLFAGRLIDGGRMGAVILGGKACCLLALVVMLCMPWESTFFISALFYGLGTGLAMPAYQTLFILLAGARQRGLANSSFFIAWDGGIGLALFAGGFIAELSSFATLYAVGGAALLVAAVYYRFRVEEGRQAVS